MKQNTHILAIVKGEKDQQLLWLEIDLLENDLILQDVAIRIPVGKGLLQMKSVLPHPERQRRQSFHFELGYWHYSSFIYTELFA